MRRLLLVLLLVAGLTAIGRGVVPCDTFQAQPGCYVALLPGPTEDALQVTQVTGIETFPSRGELLLTTVAVQADVSFFQWVANAVNPGVDQVDRDRIFPPGSDDDQVRQQNVVAMEESQYDATLAALAYLGYDLDEVFDGAEIVEVMTPTSIVDGQLEAGDIIVAVEGEATLSNSAVGDAVRARSVGDTIAVTFLRGGQERTTEVELVANPEDASIPLMGVLLTSHLDLPVDVTIDAGAIGGPSAGLAFSLAIIDLLGEEDLTGGAVVAGTGTIDTAGTVGAIGGVTQKIIGATDRSGEAPATVFLVPRGNFAEAQAAPVDRDLLLVPVDTLSDAVEVLRDLNAGRTPAEALAIGPTG